MKNTCKYYACVICKKVLVVFLIKFLSLFLLCVICWTHDAKALGTDVVCSPTNCYPAGSCPILTLSACKTSTTKYYNGYGVVSCETCGEGQERVLKTITVPGCINKPSYYDCQYSCEECPDYESQDWANAGMLSPYEKKVTAICNKITCTCSKRTSYRCARGYYGAADLSGTSGCTQCPYAGKAVLSGNLTFIVNGQTEAAGNDNVITDCYAPNTYVYEDAVGKYSFTENCNYTE